MSVWLCLPSARLPEEANKVLRLWRTQGYKIALWRDSVALSDQLICDALLFGEYPGYAEAVNRLVKLVLHDEPECQWIVTAGDDTQPDLAHSAEQIAMECSMHFAELHAGPDAAPGVGLSVKSLEAGIRGINHRTFGVMQPTGHRWGDKDGAYIDRVAGSPWMGREWCLRVNQGNGPLWPEYYHMGVDQELQEVAIKLGVFWQRPDLIHLHQHWGLPKPGERMGQQSNMPDFLKKANSLEHWNTYKKLFHDRKANGFPGHEPLAQGAML
jgi:hypothetical protein